MLKARLFAAVALLWFCTSAWAGGSTINPAVPAFGAAMSSTPIRNNFASAFSDVNNLIGQNNSVTAPASPVLGQLWLNTSAAPYVLNEWDGSAWVAQGNLNASTHAWSFPLTGVVPWSTLTGTPTTLAGYGITNGVSSVGLTMPSAFSCAGSPITSSGTISCAYSSQSQGMFLASPVGSTGAPTFRVIQPSDIPTLNQSTTGNAATATTATLATSALSANTAGNVSGLVGFANGGTASTTAAAAFNALSPMTTTGDTEYETSSGTAARLPIGSAGQVYTVVSGKPAWTAFSGGLTVLPGYINGFTLSNDGTTPNSVLDVAAGTAADSTNVATITGSAFTKSTAGAWTAGSGSGGMGTGLTVAASTWYHVFAIIKSGAFDVYFDTSPIAANAPAGTAYVRYIGSFKTNASSQILAFTQYGQKFVWAVTPTDLSSGASATTTSVTLSVPKGFVVFPILRVDTPAGSTNYQTFIYEGTSSVIDSQIFGSVTGAGTAEVQLQSVTNTASQVSYMTNIGSVYIYTTGYINPRVAPNY